jgi:regulator of protease activity HflC (stomatin/prohibitin superfamily)
MLFVFFLILLIASIIIYRRSRNLIANPIKTISPFAVGVFAILTLLQCFTVVPAGNVGVVDFFGMVSDNTLKAGINPVNPLAKVVKFSVKTQELKEDLDVPSKEGLTVGLEISVLFHLNPEMAASIYKTVGENYGQIILIPQFRSVCRGVTASYDARALYTSERELLAQEILKELSAIVKKRGINIESTPLRQVMLPPGLSQSIEAKLQAEQESQRMQFVLAKEEQEAQRKRIEAKGIADFQDIVARGISEPLLRWKGIEATEKLATSPNAKVVVIGAGKDGLPLILDTK